MVISETPVSCLRGVIRTARRSQCRSIHVSIRPQASQQRPSIAPKPTIDIKHIRENPSLYEQNCLARNYVEQAPYAATIISNLKQWHTLQHSARSLRERNNRLKLLLANRLDDDSQDSRELKELSRDQLLEEGRQLKQRISEIEEQESKLKAENETLAEAIPNLTSDETPRGDEPQIVGFINNHPDPNPTTSKRVWRSHVDIGKELNLFDFAGSATTSGWGWYILLNEAAQLEQALIQYALSTARKRGWSMVSPPSMVYTHIASACGFKPRDQNGETQIYNIQQSEGDTGVKPQLSLAGTAEIPLAGMKANSVLEEDDLPLRTVGVSRSFRAEAGSRGVDTKGLYRVHEFTKVEMFAWTLPNSAAATKIFEEMLSIQMEILESLGLHCQILEMPSTDLGASASRKRDIEAFFPSRRTANDEGWGEVTSTSICLDYQSRRLAAKLKLKKPDGKVTFPYTVNGTALAVPRILAAILENGWDEEKREVRIPQVLRPWMDDMISIAKD